MLILVVEELGNFVIKTDVVGKIFKDEVINGDKGSSWLAVEDFK